MKFTQKLRNIVFFFLCIGLLGCSSKEDNKFIGQILGSAAGAYLGSKIDTIIPKTFHIVNGETDPQFIKFLKYKESSGIDIWIVKPGENSNRGSGIEVISDETAMR